MDTFETQFFETLLWQALNIHDENGESTGERIEDRFYVSDLDPLAVAELKAELEDFTEEACEMLDAEGNGDAHDAHIFCLTRNRHGAGFWDGDYPTYGEALTEMSHGYGEIHLYVGDDGRLYVAGYGNG